MSENTAEQIQKEAADEKVAKIEEVILLTGKSAGAMLVVLFRLLELKNNISIVIEDSDEVYQLELRKISDLDTTSKKNIEPSLVNELQVTVDKYE